MLIILLSVLKMMLVKILLTSNSNINVKNCDSNSNNSTINDNYVTSSQCCGYSNVDGKKVETIMKDTKRAHHEFASGNEVLNQAQVLAVIDLGLENTPNIHVITGLKHNVHVSVADGHNFSVILRDYRTDKNTHAESNFNNTKIFDIEYCNHNTNKYHVSRFCTNQRIIGIPENTIVVSASSQTVLLLVKLCIYTCFSIYGIVDYVAGDKQESRKQATSLVIAKKQNTRMETWKERFMLQKHFCPSDLLRVNCYVFAVCFL